MFAIHRIYSPRGLRTTTLAWIAYTLAVAIGIIVIVVRFGLTPPLLQYGSIAAGANRRIPIGILRSNALQYLSARWIPRNHRLSELDLVEPPGLDADLRDRLPKRNELTGKYLRGNVGPGETIASNDLSDVPLFSVDDRKVVVRVGLPPGKLLDRSLQPGSLVCVQTETNLAAPADVVAVAPNAGFKSSDVTAAVLVAIRRDSLLRLGGASNATPSLKLVKRDASCD